MPKPAPRRGPSPRRSSGHTPRESSSGYFARHWHGEQSLAVSFWVNNVLLPLPLGMAIGAVTAWISLFGHTLQAGAIAVLIGWPLMLALQTWCSVGAWRAAGAYARIGGAALWTLLTRVIVGSGLLLTVASAAFNFVPQVGGYLKMARGIDPIGHLEAALSPDGRRLRLQGPLGLGDAQRMKLLLAGAPALRVVEIESPGGRVREAQAVAELLRERQPMMRAVGACESACTLVFMAGRQRLLLGSAQLGFHRASTGTFNPVLDEIVNRELAGYYEQAGLPSHLIAQAQRTPAWRMWYPTTDELIAAGVVQATPRTLDVELPPAAGSQPQDVIDAMETNGTWQALDRRYPGTVAAAAARMHEARSHGADDTAALVEGQRVVEALLPRLMADAGPEMRVLFLQVLTAQLQAARAAGAAACRAVQAGDAAARRALPAEVVEREAAWLVDATAEPPRSGPPRMASALELEVLRRSLGERAPALLSTVWRPASPARDCDGPIALLTDIARLPPAERKLATRVALERR